MRRIGVIGSHSVSARKHQKNEVLQRAIIETLDPRRLLATITVTGTGDTIANDGVVTLREAITAANTNAPSGDAPAGDPADTAQDYIYFDIPTNGPVPSIQLTSALPAITEAVFIDGTTESGATNTFVELNGAAAGGGVDGLKIQASGVSVIGLVINRFSGNGISALNAHELTLGSNIIGTDVVDTPSIGNGGDGILLDGVSNSSIGNNYYASYNGNTIAGNALHGIELKNSSDGNTLSGNRIGLDFDNGPLGNLKDGLHISDSGDNIIGGDTGDVISANKGYGIFIRGAGSTHNSIQSVTVGGDSAEFGNALDGIYTEGSHTDIGSYYQMYVQNNGGAGIHIAAGRFDRIVDSLISQNQAQGILIETPNNTVGSDYGPSGSTIDGNTGAGIELLAGAHDCSIFGNNFGLSEGNGAGIILNGAANNDVHSNLIDGSVGDGILIKGATATGNKLTDNTIGYDYNSNPIPNHGAGIEVQSSGNTIGGNTNLNTFNGNHIAGNDGAGILISGNNNVVAGNSIGFDDTFHDAVVGNLVGIRLTGNASGNIIGGTVADQGNDIAYNGIGVSVVGNAVSNAILSNSIHDNVLLGIDLNDDGPTANDPGDVTPGPNNLQNTPVISSVTSSTLGTTISGSLNSAQNTTFLIQFFSQLTSDASGFGEGDRLLGQATVTTNGSGVATFQADVTDVLVNTTNVTATATRMNGTSPLSTSEFSADAVVTGNPPVIQVSDSFDDEGDGGSTDITFDLFLSDAVNVPVTVDYATADGTATSPSDYIAQSGTVTFAPGQTEAHISINLNGDTTIEPSETFAINFSNSVNAQLSAAQVVGTINNDDFPPPPNLTINDVSASEGNSGQKQFVFTLTRSGDLSESSEVECYTFGQTAQEDVDYVGDDRYVSFGAGQKTATFTVLVNGDTQVESDETFVVQVLNIDNVSIQRSQAFGTIKNDDGAQPPPGGSGKVSVVTDPTDSTRKALKIEGTSNADTITVTRSGSSQGKAGVKINGANKGTFSFSGNILVYGNAGNDNISIDSAITRSVFAFGGDGKDTFSGGGGNDVIFGDASNDSIKGGNGRDILVGGSSTDKLDGGSGDDILIGGDFKTAPSFAQLASLLKEWTRTDANYATRSSHMKSGGGFNSIKLTSSTLFSAANVHDSLTGGSNNDLFFASVPGGVLTDKTGAESLTDIG